MGRLIELKDGSLQSVLTDQDLLDLIDRYMGQEMKEAVIEWVNEMELQHADDDECIHELNEMISEDHKHYKETMGRIREEAEKLNDLITAKDLDRGKISNAVGAIGVMAYREVCRC